MGFLMGHSAWQIDQFPTCWPMNGLFVHWSRGWGVSSFSERLVLTAIYANLVSVDGIVSLVMVPWGDLVSTGVLRQHMLMVKYCHLQQETNNGVMLLHMYHRYVVLTDRWRNDNVIVRQNDVATSFWRNYDIIIAAGVRWRVAAIAGAIKFAHHCHCQN